MDNPHRHGRPYQTSRGKREIIMNRQEFLKEIASGRLSDVKATDLPVHFEVKSYDLLPSLMGDYPGIIISVVGAGPLGARVVGSMANAVPGISCHGVLFDPKKQNLLGMNALLSSVLKSDLLFILSGFDDGYSGSIVSLVANAAREAGVLTVTVAPETEVWNTQALRNREVLFAISDSLILVSGNSLSNGHIPFVGQPLRQGNLMEDAMRYAVAGITQLIHQHFLIGVDFYDVALVMRTGGVGRLGVGRAAGESKGATATRSALERIASQGGPDRDATGVLVCVCGSSRLSMDTFAEVSEAIGDAFPEHPTIIIGPAVDDEMGETVSVSIFALRKQIA